MPLSGPNPSDQAAFQNEWKALLAFASPARGKDRLSKLLSVVDWSRLVFLAEQHGVVAHLASGLKDCPREVPQEVRQAILELERVQNFQTLRLTAELFRILDLLRAKDISALAIKGPVLSMRAYGDPAMRSYGDLDLLVGQSDIRCATEAMLAAGFEAAVPLSAIDAGKIPGQYLFSKPASKLLVELHNDLTLRYFPRPLPIADFFARQEHVQVDAYEVPALATEDELVLISIHGAKHFWERLMWIADVAALVALDTAMDWEKANASARSVCALHLLNTGLRLALELLGAPLPRKVIEQVESDRCAGKLVEKIQGWLPAAGYRPPGLLERAAFRWHMRGGVFRAPAYLLRLSLSPTEEDWQPAGQPSHSHFLDILRRPFRLVRKYGRNPKS